MLGTFFQKKNSNNTRIDVSKFPNGMYICEIKNKGISLGKQKFLKIE